MRRNRSVWGAALAAGTLAVTAAVAAPGARATTLAARTGNGSGSAKALRVITYNICGNACGNKHGYDNSRRIASIVAQAGSGGWNASEIHLQEVCRTQYDALLSRLGPSGFHGVYAATLSDRSDVCGGSDYGVAVLVRAPVTDSRVLTLTVGGESEPIKAACAKSAASGPVNWACSVHLYWNDDSLRETEAQVLSAQTKAWQASGTPVVLAGDFNDDPTSAPMSQFYDRGLGGGATGGFTEADQTNTSHFTSAACRSRGSCRSGAPTFASHKIDYVFADSRHVRQVSGSVVPLDSRVSDHRMLRGEVTWS